MYRVLRTIKLDRGLARSPGDEFTQADINDIPEKIRARRVQGLLDRGKIIWEQDPKEKLAEAKKIVEAAETSEEKVQVAVADNVEVKVEKTPKKRGRPPKGD